MEHMIRQISDMLIELEDEADLATTIEGNVNIGHAHRHLRMVRESLIEAVRHETVEATRRHEMALEAWFEVIGVPV